MAGCKPNEHIAPGVVLGEIAINKPRPVRSKAYVSMLLPLQGVGYITMKFPRAMPWAMCFCPLRGALIVFNSKVIVT